MHLSTVFGLSLRIFVVLLFYFTAKLKTAPKLLLGECHIMGTPVPCTLQSRQTMSRGHSSAPLIRLERFARNKALQHGECPVRLCAWDHVPRATHSGKSEAALIFLCIASNLTPDIPWTPWGCDGESARLKPVAGTRSGNNAVDIATEKEDKREKKKARVSEK